MTDKVRAHQETNGQDDAPGKREHRRCPVRQTSGFFDEDGHYAFRVVRPTAHDENGRYLDHVQNHDPPQRTNGVVQVVDYRYANLHETPIISKL